MLSVKRSKIGIRALEAMAVAVGALVLAPGGAARASTELWIGYAWDGGPLLTASQGQSGVLSVHGNYVVDGVDMTGNELAASVTAVPIYAQPGESEIIYVSETGLSLAGPIRFVSGFTDNATAVGSTVTELTWLDPGDKQFGLTTLLGGPVELDSNRNTVGSGSGTIPRGYFCTKAAVSTNFNGGC